MSKKDLRRQLRLTTIPQNFIGDSLDKDEFHGTARLILRRVAKSLVQQGYLSPADYTIRSNKAGSAVLGEVILHTNWFYLMIGESGILYRLCNSLDDYTGGQNRWLHYGVLRDNIINQEGSIESILLDKIYYLDSLKTF